MSASWRGFWIKSPYSCLLPVLLPLPYELSFLMGFYLAALIGAAACSQRERHASGMQPKDSLYLDGVGPPLSSLSCPDALTSTSQDHHRPHPIVCSKLAWKLSIVQPDAARAMIWLEEA